MWAGADPDPNDQAALWPAIIEKAFAQQKPTGYAGLFAGDPGMAMASLTGKFPRVWEDWQAGTVTEDQIMAMLAESKQGANPAVAGTAGVSGQILPSGLNAQHAYTVLGTEERDGQVFVKLYNPFGFSDGDTDSRDKAPADPFVTVPLSEFARDFQSLRVGHALGKDLEAKEYGPGGQASWRDGGAPPFAID